MEKLIKVLKAAKPTLDMDSLQNSKDLYGNGIFDSFDIIIIIDEINAAFGTSISGTDFSRKDFRTVNDVYDMIKRHGGE